MLNGCTKLKNYSQRSLKE